MWTNNRLLSALAVVAAVCASVPGADAAGLRTASKPGKASPDAFISTTPLGWNFNAQSPAAAGDIFKYGRSMLALQAGTQTDRLGNTLPQGAILTNGQRYAQTTSAGVVTDNTAWAKSQGNSIGIDGNFVGIFSAGVDYTSMASSSFAESTTQQYVQIAGSLQLQRVTLPVFELSLASDVTEALTALPPLGDATSLQAYAAFFNDWDAHIITEYTIGGSAHMFSSFDSSTTKSASIDSQTVGAYIQASFAKWGAGVAGNHSWSNAQGQVLKQVTSDTKIRCRGGEATICAEFSMDNATASYENWVQSITAENAAAMIVTSAEPLWSQHTQPVFLPRSGLAADLEKAYTMYLAACPGAAVGNGFICAGRGECSLEKIPTGGNGTCDCFPGYGGPMCACPSNSATEDCSGHGTCSSTNSPGTCTCHPRWGGKDCSAKALPCPQDHIFGTGECGVDNDNGQCDGSTGKCTCSEGRTGAACNIPCGDAAMTTAIAPPNNLPSSWWDLAYYQDNTIGRALKAGSSILYTWQDGEHTSHDASSGSISTGENHNAFDNAAKYSFPEKYADGICQFIFNYVVGQGTAAADGNTTEISRIPIHQVRPAYFGSGYLDFLGHSIWQLDNYGYPITNKTTTAGPLPTTTTYHDFNSEYSGTGYYCTAKCMPN